MQRDYSTISPSARALLLMKALTPIPFAKEAADLIIKKDENITQEEQDLFFWIRTMHFEERYTSVNQLLEDIEPTNILELSSGFSFRGLDFTTTKENIHYIDTDLPELIETKKGLLTDIKAQGKANSQLEVRPLNALHKEEFMKIVDSFPSGPVTIVNEGLLMYLGDEEKLKLCGIIQEVLKKRGGYWVTADIYIKNEMAKMPFTKKDELSELIERENIEEKKFESFEQAAEFFTDAGFIIDKVAQPDYQALSSTKEVINLLPQEALQGNQKPPTIHETWRLKVAE